LEARQIDASNERLVGEALGEIELEESVLVIRRIHVRLRFRAEEGHRETANRVHGIFAQKMSGLPQFESGNHDDD
jgi:hypothetical protein